MQIETKITEADYKKLRKFMQKWLMRSHFQSKYLWLKRMALWMIIFIVFFFIFSKTSFSLSDLHIPTLIVALVPSFSFILFYIYFLINIQKRALPRKDGIIIGNKLFELNEEGISMTTLLGNSFYKWRAVESVCENAGDIYIFFDRAFAHQIPASAFKNSDERAAFVKFVRSKMTT